MFPENLRVTEGLEILLTNIEKTLEKNKTINEIKLSLDKVDIYFKKADNFEKKLIPQIKEILTELLFSEAMLIAFTKFENYQLKLDALSPVYEALKEVEIIKPKHRYYFCNITNRIIGLKYYISKKAKAAS
jgi:hypothetical protein